MTKIERTIWGRTLQLEVSYDCFEDENILPSQEEALVNLIGQWSEVESSLDAVKEYCEKNSAGQIRAKEIKNIFKYVVPRSLYVARKPRATVALMCDFKFDLEHGMALVFKDEKLDRIGTQDSVL